MLTRILPVPKHPEDQLKEISSDGTSSLDLSQRTINSLEKNGVRTIGDLMQCCDQPLSECDMTGGPEAKCKCLQGFKEGSSERREWVPKCYLREIPGFADITIERIKVALKKKLSEIH